MYLDQGTEKRKGKEGFFSGGNVHGMLRRGGFRLLSSNGSEAREMKEETGGGTPGNGGTWLVTAVYTTRKGTCRRPWRWRQLCLCGYEEVTIARSSCPDMKEGVSGPSPVSAQSSSVPLLG